MQWTHSCRTALLPRGEQPVESPPDHESHSYLFEALAASVPDAAWRVTCCAALTGYYAAACNDPAATGETAAAGRAVCLEMVWLK